ncbi:hypothetical protein [Nocardiopsis algeriensis]|uniref:Ribosomal protein L32 n=1 Tax=Nocardiopsis algeriensis TaxID=1478215 RepID=A0A841IVL3_9ACTN|nr:hypothetical protein [Nocardiopsis algeriensis]MBB6122212.1 ribosomal protein L32 [Nocardiopsis algeriensis]
MPRIELELYTDDPAWAAALRSYWTLNEDGHGWAQTVAEVRAQHQLTSPEMTQLVRTCGSARLTDITCSKCGESWTVANRTEYAEVLRADNGVCESCHALAQAARLQAAKERKQHQRSRLIETFPTNTHDQPSVEELSLFQAIGLHTLFSDPAVEDSGMTTPTRGWPKERPWCPGSLLLDYERRLIHSNPATIFAHHDSHIDAFVWEDDAPTGSFYLGNISYYLIGPQPDPAERSPQLLQDLNRVFRQGPWPATWLEQWRPLWEELTLAYASAYLDMKLREHHLEMKQGEGTLTALQDALATFSLGQVFNLIYRATRDSAAYYQRGGITKRQAANSTVGRISGSADRVRANGWDIKSFNLPWNLPLTAFGEVFFYKVMWQADMIHALIDEVRVPAHAVEPVAEE